MAPTPGAPYIATVTGGTAPFTYQWKVKQDGLGQYLDVLLNPAGNKKFVTPSFGVNPTNQQQVAVLLPAADEIVFGLIQVKVTDANGLVTYNSYLVQLTATPD